MKIALHWLQLLKEQAVTLLLVVGAIIIVASPIQEAPLENSNTTASSATPTASVIIVSSSARPLATTSPAVRYVPKSQPAPTQRTALCDVAKVVDGDTIDVVCNGITERVRYIGIDTTETVDPRKEVQCFGKEASKQNSALVTGKKVRLEKDITDYDRYGRALRYVYVDDVFINLELVRGGYARVYTYPPDVKHDSTFLEAQKEAMSVRAGLWGLCLESTPSLAPTAQFVPQESPKSATCTIKGNISAADEKIYHLIGCDSYSKTQIDESVGEHWFCTEQEAVTAGWRKALNCD